jgi:ATP-dependent DNA helicase RecG
MRPAILNPLFVPARSLKGVGEKVEKLLAAFLRGPGGGEARLVDLIFHLPTGVIDRRQRPLIRDLPPSGVVTVLATVGKHKAPPRFKKGIPYRVEVHDETGTLTLTFFHGFADTIQRQLPEGEQRYISGAVSWYDGSPQISHPDYVLSADEFGRMPLIDPI